MDHKKYAQQVLTLLGSPPQTPLPYRPDDSSQKNAARCMTYLVCRRLATDGEEPDKLYHTTFQWKGGVFCVKNCRITDGHWSTLQLSAAEKLHEQAAERPVVYLFTHWLVEEGILRAWAVPIDVAERAFAKIPQSTKGSHKTIQIYPTKQRFDDAPDSDDLTEFYVSTELRDVEKSSLVGAIKVDGAAKLASQNDVEEGEEDEGDAEPIVFFTESTVQFLKELDDHMDDPEWHEANKPRYKKLLKEPAQQLADVLRDEYVQSLSPEVAGAKNLLSRLKKNDFGKGGYHNHFWFAFYDPAAKSKTKSVQLFFRVVGGEQIWRYGFSMGRYCDQYMQRLMAVIATNANRVADFIEAAPPKSIVHFRTDGKQQKTTPAEFAAKIRDQQGQFGKDLAYEHMDFVREFPLDSLPDHNEQLVQEIGEYFEWAWPFFEASMTGSWADHYQVSHDPMDVEDEDVDEDAPVSLEELAKSTSLSIGFLKDLDQALLAKQQAVLVGPPGTSKTYIASQFARFFVRQKTARPQGTYKVLYMHANWAYEDFFEGLKPTTSPEGGLAFENRRGFFLNWVESLKELNPGARHVLVLDEINRCDTAAVLGELLQLLEYRGTTVPLLSGRQFVFPRNLFIIGTMNSADRSIGRLDLALRRRFLWLDLHPQPDTLDGWLEGTGNNQVGFQASSLKSCNKMLADQGIPPEQHIGHALFMAHDNSSDGASDFDGGALTERRLRQIVKFSVLPYVRELLISQFGQVDSSLINKISSTLLSCVDQQDEAEVNG